MSVFSPETMDGGHWGAGFRLAYTRPDHRSDDELEALAERGIAAHNTDYNLNASLGVAYGVNHHITLSVELPYVLRDKLREADDGDVQGLLRDVTARTGIGLRLSLERDAKSG